jgi:hypothetical protein
MVCLVKQDHFLGKPFQATGVGNREMNMLAGFWPIATINLTGGSGGYKGMGLGMELNRSREAIAPHYASGSVQSHHMADFRRFWIKRTLHLEGSLSITVNQCCGLIMAGKFQV